MLEGRPFGQLTHEEDDVGVAQRRNHGGLLLHRPQQSRSLGLCLLPATPASPSYSQPTGAACLPILPMRFLRAAPLARRLH